MATAEDRASRRVQGQSPEFGLWMGPPRKKPTKATMTSWGQQAETPATASPDLPVAPRTPAPFQGEAYEDVEDWLQQHERVALYNRWTPNQRLQNVYIPSREPRDAGLKL